MGDPILTLPPRLPTHSLGPQVFDWCQQYVRQPDGPDAGTPWRFTPEQIRFLHYLYSVNSRGRFLWNRSVLRRAKGWGKSPLMAAIALAELVGPVRFGGWDEAGNPIGIPVGLAWVQIAGVSERQTLNTYSMVTAMVAESPIVDEYGLDVGLTRIFVPGGGRLEPITASSTTAEGARPTFVVLDETHLWVSSNGGHKLAEVIRRNLGKSRDGMARSVESTNAHAFGEQSVAERSHEAWLAQQEGRARTEGLLYDSREAPADTDLADEQSLMVGLDAAYGDSSWVDLERVRDEVWDPGTPPETSRRFYLNQVSAAVDAWIAGPAWAACAAPGKVIGDREIITLGFDGSRSRARGVTDATALVGCRVSDGHLFEIAVWEQPDGQPDWQVPTGEVDGAIDWVFRQFDVVGFYADPNMWESYIAGWESRYGARLKVKAAQAHPIERWFGRTFVRALEQFRGAVLDGELTHDGSFALTRHVTNARMRTSTAGLQIAKPHPESSMKIDACIAAVLAWEARLDAVAAGLDRPPVLEDLTVRRIR